MDKGYALPDLKFSPSLFLADGYFIVSKQTPDAVGLLARMEKAYKKLVNNRTFKGMIVE